jgi:putative flippase GtrA
MLSLTKLKSNRFVLFCIVGAISSLIDIALLYVGVSVLHLHLFVAATLSFALASVNGYMLNRLMTFKTARASTAQYLQYLLVSIVGLGLTLLFMHVLTAYLLLHYLLAKIVTIVLVVFWNYFANAFWTFRTKP